MGKLFLCALIIRYSMDILFRNMYIGIYNTKGKERGTIRNKAKKNDTEA